MRHFAKLINRLKQWNSEYCCIINSVRFYSFLMQHNSTRAFASYDLSLGKLTDLRQWRNRQGAGGQSAPRDFWSGNFCWRIGKKEARKKGKRGENWEEKKENCKREGGKLEMEVGKKRWGPFFFFLLFTFENDGNLFWVYQNGNFFTRKKHFMPGKIPGKMTLPPQKNMPVTPLICDTPLTSNIYPGGCYTSCLPPHSSMPKMMRKFTMKEIYRLWKLIMQRLNIYL